MVSKLLTGQYSAVISDDTQLIARANADATCKLHVLPERIEAFDLAFAFRSTWNDSALIRAINFSLLQLQEEGILSVRPCRALSRMIPCE